MWLRSRNKGRCLTDLALGAWIALGQERHVTAPAGAHPAEEAME